jgi:hypothetical protein
MELRLMYGGPSDDPGQVFKNSYSPASSIEPKPMPRPEPVRLEGWPISTEQAGAAQAALGDTRGELELADGVRPTLVRVPAGRVVMGDDDGEPDEYPQRALSSAPRPARAGSAKRDRLRRAPRRKK